MSFAKSRRSILSDKALLRRISVAAVLAVLGVAAVLFNIRTGTGAPQPNTGNMITTAAAQRAGAIVLPTSKNE
jgi:hypothetical protein